MKLIHLSDLHIGKRVYEYSMLEDQRYILGEILSIVEKERPDGVLIAGDIYDKPVPPAEAVQVFDWFLTGLADFGTAVFLVSGNHDSAERIAFGAELMKDRRVYVSPVYDGEGKKVRLEDAYGEVCICLLPFLKPALVRQAQRGRGDSSQEKIETYQDALEAAVRCLNIDPAERNVLVAHQFVTGAAQCKSEDFQVGGIDQVAASVFDAFDYVALGHLHSPQHVSRETLRYCGTPLKYSFSEAGQEKSVTVVELLEKGTVKLREIPLVPMRDMRERKGTYMELLARPSYEGTNTEDYLRVVLTDEEDVPDGLQKLRTVYPNLMCLEYDNERTRRQQTVEGASAVEEKTELELFEEFYELQNNQPMSEKQKAFAGEIIRRLKGAGEVEA